MCPNLDVKEEIFIPLDDITLICADGNNSVTIQAPSSHLPPAPIRCLLLSKKLRDGQVCFFTYI